MVWYLYKRYYVLMYAKTVMESMVSAWRLLESTKSESFTHLVASILLRGSYVS